MTKRATKIVVGKVSTVFGIKGEVKLVSYCDDPLRIMDYKLFDNAGNEVRLEISKSSLRRTAAGDAIIIAKIDGVNTRNDAELWRNKEIFTNRDEFDELKENEFYCADLIGLNVVDAKLKKIGKVIDVFDYGAGTIIEIEFDQASSQRNIEKIENFPFKDEIFPEVNLSQHFIRIEMPEIKRS